MIAANMFLVALNTGLRLNELIGLSLADFYPGEPVYKPLTMALQNLGMKALGYIILESQPADPVSIRTDSGIVKRKPLKGKKRISDSENRTIPILDKQTFNTLARLWNTQRDLLEKKQYGSDPKDYLLFQGLNKNVYSNALKRAGLGPENCEGDNVSLVASR